MTNWIVSTQNSSLTIRPLAAAVASCLRRTVKRTVPATGLALILATPGMAATYQVINTNDAGPGSLRQAVVDANENAGTDQISFDSSVSGTLNLVSGPLELLDSVSVKGPGQALLTVDAGGSSEIFVVSDSAPVSAIEVSVSDLTLSNATTAILAEVGFMDLAVTVTDSTISGSVENGVSVSSYFAESMLRVSNSTLSKNGSDAISVAGSPYSGGNGAVLEGVALLDNGGAGVDNSGAGVKISNSEIRGNSIGLLGGAARNYFGGGFNITDTIIADSEEEGVVLGHSDHLNLERSSITGSGGAGVVASNFFVSATIRASTISDNGEGGVDFGIRDNELTIANSTLSQNRNGFGVRFYSYQGNASIQNSTITGNGSGGVYGDGIESALEVSNSIIAGNGSSGGTDLSGEGAFTVHHSLIQQPGDSRVFESAPGSNIIGEDPLLGPLQENGGSTLTHALLVGSPAIDQGEDATCPETDQRGVTRPQDGNADRLAICDMGAYEAAAGTGANNGRGFMGDFVWRDDDGDGVQDPEEPGLAGVVVNLQVNCDPGQLLTTVTDSNGAYRFDGLATGNYQLQFVKPVGYRFSPAVAAGNYLLDSNADPETGLDRCRSVREGLIRPALDAGLIPDSMGGGSNSGSGAIGDLVWRDVNGDGKQDPGEPGVPGVTVNLLVGCDPATLLSTTTDSNGAFRFSGLSVGRYQLEFVQPAGYTFSPLIAAEDYTQDSNADPASGLDQCRSLAEGQTRSGLDAGLVP